VDILGSLAAGFAIALTPTNLLYCLLGSLVGTAIGVLPGLLYSILPRPVAYEPYTTSHVVSQLQLLFWSALAFTVLKLTGLYPPEMRSTNLDCDWTWRRLVPAVWRAAFLPALRAVEVARNTVCESIAVLVATASLRRRVWGSETAVLAILAMLILFVFLGLRD